MDAVEKQKDQTDKDRKLVEEAQKLYSESIAYWNKNRTEFKDDLSFYSGDTQWPDNVIRERELEQRPCLTVNRLPQFVRQVVNDQRMNKPSIKVRAADDHADIETAEVLQGLIRHIESNSDADIAYDNAFFYAVTAGFGFFRVVTEYAEDSFEQEIFIRPIPNPLTVITDINDTSLDGSGMEYCFIVEEMSRDKFKKAYPDVDMQSWDTQMSGEWVTRDTVKVAEYFYKEYKDDILVQTIDGKTMYASEFVGDANTIINSRDCKRPFVKWAKLAGDTVLERADWAGKYIPIIPVFGDTIENLGRRRYISLIRFAKDPQRMLNYYRSTETELLALQPKSPFVAAEGQIEDYEDEWKSANNINYSVLTYKPVSLNGQPVPPPQRQGFAGTPSGVLQGAINAQQDMMATTGIYESSLGQKSNESSGRAIEARAREGDTATFHFIDNMSRAIRLCGRILIDLIPIIYDTPRVVRILGEDGTEEVTKVNEPIVEKDDKGNPIQRIYDLGLGKYDVTVSSGPSYTTRRQEAEQAMIQISQANPQMWAVAGDLMVKSMDWPNAEELSERLKLALPPQLQPQDEEGPQIPPDVQQKLQEDDQIIQQMQQAIQQMQSELADKQAQMQLDAQRVQIEMARAETERIRAENERAKVQSDSAPKQVPDSVSEHEKINHDSEIKVLLKKMDVEKDILLADKKLEAEKELELLKIIAANEQKPPMQDMEQKPCVEDLIKKLTAPKEIIRDANGRPIGIRTVDNAAD